MLYLYVICVSSTKYPLLVGKYLLTCWWVYFYLKRFFQRYCSNIESSGQEEAAPTNFGLNSSGDRRRYMVIRVCVAVGTLLPLRLNWRSPSASELVLLWGLEETRLLGREYTCRCREQQDAGTILATESTSSVSSGQTSIATSWFLRGFLWCDKVGERQQTSTLMGIRWGHGPQSFNAQNRFPLYFRCIFTTSWLATCLSD